MRDTVGKALAVQDVLDVCRLYRLVNQFLLMTKHTDCHLQEKVRKEEEWFCVLNIHYSILAYLLILHHDQTHLHVLSAKRSGIEKDEKFSALYI